MKGLISFLFYPFFFVWVTYCKSFDVVKADAIACCEHHRMDYSLRNYCHLFISDKAVRNLLYHRMGRRGRLFKLFFPGYDHLQIITPPKSIGKGLVFQHGFSTIVGAKRIGCNCKIYQQVTIGYNHRLECPILGDNVEVCCGAKIIGGCKIGNNVLIGANSVVTKDIPDNCVVAGIPARIIRTLPPNTTVFDRCKK